MAFSIRFILCASAAALALAAPGKGEARAGEPQTGLDTIETLCLQSSIVNTDQGRKLATAFRTLKMASPSTEAVRHAALLLVYKITHDYWQLRSFCLDLRKQTEDRSLQAVLRLNPAVLGRLEQELARFGQALIMERPLIDNPPERLTGEESWEIIDTHLGFIAGDGEARLAQLWRSFEALLRGPMVGTEQKYQAALSKVRQAWRRPGDLEALPEDEVRFVKVFGRSRMYYRRFAGLTGP